VRILANKHGVTLVGPCQFIVLNMLTSASFSMLLVLFGQVQFRVVLL
jgi:hypothetical protein